MVGNAVGSAHSVFWPNTIQTMATCQRDISQHFWAQHVACVWLPCCDVLQHVGCFWLENGQIWANNTQHLATCRNKVAKRTKHVVPNNVAICCVGMFRSFGRGLIHLCCLFKISSNHNWPVQVIQKFWFWHCICVNLPRWHFVKYNIRFDNCKV